MGKLYEVIDENLRQFVEKQRVFFVATAPLSAAGHVNCSPKGFDSLRVLGDRTLAYLDYMGSGVETIAHLRENGRIVIMLCAFEGPPKIVRFHGTGTVIEPSDSAFPELLGLFEPKQGVRSIIKLEVTRIADSCGFGVPLFGYEGERTQHAAWASKKGEEGLAAYRDEKNALSIDHLPGLSRR